MYDQQQAAIDRQNMIAQALRESGNIPSSRVGLTASGGLAVPISPFEAASKLFQSGLGTYEGYKAQKDTDALNAQKDQDAQTQLKGILDQLTGPSQTAVPSDNTQPPIGATTNFQDASGAAQPQQPSVPGAGLQEQNPRRAAMAAILKNADPQQAVAMLRGPALSALEPKPDYTLAEGATRISGATGQPVASGAPKTYKPDEADRSLVKIIDKSKPEGYSTIKRSDFDPTKMNEWTPPTASTNAAALAGSMTGDALQDAAARYRMFGELPPGAGRSPAMGIKIMNAAAEQALAAGDDATAAAIRQKAGKATSSALTKFEGNAQAIGGFEKLATKSADLAEELADKVSTTDIPVLNSWIQTGVKNFTPGSALASFAGQTETFTTEYGKIMSGSLNNTALSDTAAAHARALINTGMQNGTYHDVMKTLRRDMTNRIASQSEERSDLYRQLAGQGPDDIPGAKTSETAPASKTPVQVKGDADYAALPSGTVFVGPDGKTRTKP